jgi:hypothetical protein
VIETSHGKAIFTGVVSTGAVIKTFGCVGRQCIIDDRRRAADRCVFAIADKPSCIVAQMLITLKRFNSFAASGPAMLRGIQLSTRAVAHTTITGC